MNFEADDLLEHVDQWKVKLYEELRRLTPQQRAAYWKRVHDKARAAGLPLAEPAGRPKRRVKRPRRATG